MLIDDYFDYLEKYSKKYGEKTIILMQVGSFFECYAIDNKTQKKNSKNLITICDLMNIQISRKNKNIVESSRSNPLMAGFPLFAIDKFIQILINHGYTIVLIEQVTEPPEPERKVTGIYSPGTNINYCIGDDNSNLVSVFIEGIQDFKNYEKKICIGMSVIDLTTGKSIVYEAYSNSNDKYKGYDDIFRFIKTHNPKEIIFNVKNLDIGVKDLVSYLEIENKIYHFYTDKEIKSDIFKLSYQNSFLEKIYRDYGLLSVIEYLDLENKIYGIYSFISLLQFAYEHNETVINEISKPEIWESNKYLILTNDSINQLNLVDYNNQNFKFSSLLGIVNNCSTSMGKRYLKKQLLNPIIDIDKLNYRYNCIENFLERIDGEYKYEIIEKYLTKIVDIERLHRRISLGTLNPADFASLDISYQNIKNILDMNLENNLKYLLPDESYELKNKFYKFIDEYRKLFKMEDIVKYHLNNITNSFFNRGNFKNLDILQDKISLKKELLNIIGKKLSSFIENDSEYVKLEYTDKDGYYFQTTKKRGEIMKKSFINMNWKSFLVIYNDSENDKIINKKMEINPKNLNLKFLKDRTKITFDQMDIISNKLKRYQEKIKYDTTKNYKETLDSFNKEYIIILKEISKFVSKVDFYKSNAKSSIMYSYHKPNIQESEKSFLISKELRHPIIERIQNNIEYVPNDISIGEDLNGILLYGCNAVGKSSLMKAVGLAIIMAQSGMYVPSNSFTFCPFHYIFTRISDNDNLFKGQSSFAVEMSELRSILKRSNSNSIVLGDELCSGTESVSAISIFASSVIRLSSLGVNFIFATHLHELYNMAEIKILNNVKSFHLKVIYDEIEKKLIYDRKLAEGNGNAIYGLEVCKAMDLDTEFLKLANQIRRDILNIKQNIIEKKKSNFSPELYVDKCKICGMDGKETHHIQEQHLADNNGIIGNIHKNNISNLVVLCKNCHYKVHHSDLVINGYKKTSKGIELDYYYLSNQIINNKKKKYNESDIKIILEYKDKSNNNLTLSKKMLDTNGYKISKSVIKKIWEGKY